MKGLGVELLLWCLIAMGHGQLETKHETTSIPETREDLALLLLLFPDKQVSDLQIGLDAAGGEFGTATMLLLQEQMEQSNISMKENDAASQINQSVHQRKAESITVTAYSTSLITQSIATCAPTLTKTHTFIVTDLMDTSTTVRSDLVIATSVGYQAPSLINTRTVYIPHYITITQTNIVCYTPTVVPEQIEIIYETIVLSEVSTSTVQTLSTAMVTTVPSYLADKIVTQTVTEPYVITKVISICDDVSILTKTDTLIETFLRYSTSVNERPTYNTVTEIVAITQTTIICDSPPVAQQLVETVYTAITITEVATTTVTTVTIALRDPDCLINFVLDDSENKCEYDWTGQLGGNDFNYDL